MTTRTETFDPGAGPIRLAIRLSKADVHLVPVDDGPITVELTGRDPDRVRVELAGTTLTISEETTTRFRAPVDAVTVRLGAGASVDASLAVGELEADLALDQVRVKTASGDVRLGEVGGRLEAKTASGDLRVDRVRGQADISTASGDVRLGEVSGAVDCTCASGDVLIDHADGDVTVRTASGDLRVGRFAGRKLSCNSMSGDASIDVAPGRRVRYQLDSLSGDVRTSGGRGQPAPDAQTVDIKIKSMSGDLVLGVSEH